MIFVRWPRMYERPIALEPVGQMADAQSVGHGHVVMHDRPEIVEHEEDRAIGAGRGQQARFVAWMRERFAVGAGEAELLPVADGLERLVADPLDVEAFGQGHFIAPGLPWLPTSMSEVACCRGERVRHIAPDVALAIAVIVDGEFLVGGWDELRMSHGAGPRPVHLIDRNIAMLDDLERHNELLAGEGSLDVVISERRERPDHVHVAGLCAVVRLNTPDGDENGSVDAIALLDAVKEVLVLLEHLLAGGNALIRHHTVDILADRFHIFRLKARSFDHLRVWRHALERLVVGLARYAHGLGDRPESLHPLGEGLGRGLDMLRQDRTGK